MRYAKYLLLLGSLVLLGAGCGSTATTNVSVEGQTKTETTAPSVAVNVKADAFAEIPRYPKATETNRKTSDDGKESTLTLSSADDVATVASWYEEQFKANGWETSYSLTSVFSAERTASKGNEELSLSIEINTETEGATITITLKKK